MAAACPRRSSSALTHLPKPHDLTDIGSARGATRIRRLRRLDDIPVAVEEIWLDPRHRPLRPEHLSESLYKTYADRLEPHDHPCRGSGQRRHPARLGPGNAPLSTGTTMGLVERRSFDQYGTPAEASRSWFAPDRARYTARVP
jgi:GntR family transcriptional regulator